MEAAVLGLSVAAFGEAPPDRLVAPRQVREARLQRGDRGVPVGLRAIDRDVVQDLSPDRLIDLSPSDRVQKPIYSLIDVTDDLRPISAPLLRVLPGLLDRLIWPQQLGPPL